MNKMRSIPYDLDRSLHCENTWEVCQKSEINNEASAYVKGVLAALRLYEKTGYVPTEDVV